MVILAVLCSPLVPVAVSPAVAKGGYYDCQSRTKGNRCSITAKHSGYTTWANITTKPDRNYGKNQWVTARYTLEVYTAGKGWRAAWTDQHGRSANGRKTVVLKTTLISCPKRGTYRWRATVRFSGDPRSYFNVTSSTFKVP